jgi:hypothetical protein
VTNTATSTQQFSEPPHTGVTNADWAVWVLQDGGWPVTTNNVDNILAWMTAENAASTWWGTAGANNPLNNGLGSGGGSGLGSYPDLATAAQFAAKGLQGGIKGAAPIGQALAANAPFSVFHQATLNATWSGDHYAGTDWAAETSPFKVPIVTAGSKAVIGSSDAVGSAIQGAATAAADATSWTAELEKLLSDLTSASWWKRVGLFSGGLGLIIGGIVLFISTTKTGEQIESSAVTGATAAAMA